MGDTVRAGGVGTVSPLQERILAFAAALRQAKIPVAVSDGLDAMRAAAAVDLGDRAQLRAALEATMLRSSGHQPAFEALFDLYFPPRPELVGTGDQTPSTRTVEELIADLVAQVIAGDEDAISRLAAEAVATLGRVENPDGSTSYFQYRVFRQLNPAGVLRRALAEAGTTGNELADRLEHEEFDHRLRRFREEVEAEVRRRLAAQRGPEHVARNLVRPLPEEQDFFRIGVDEEAAMRRAVRPLARRLATRLAVRRKRARDGRLDARRTMRAALATGGVPIDPVFSSKRIHRPELVILCDVSGSVAAFSRFTLLFCHALQDQFSRVRSFAFVDTVDEVTRLFEGGDPAEGMRRMSSEARVVWLDGHSDYGNAFGTLLSDFGDAVTPRSTVLILGDARNNYRATNTWALSEVRRRAKRVYWLNPEPTPQWDAGDSIAGIYARHTDRMVECRNLRQLSAFVETLA